MNTKLHHAITARRLIGEINATAEFDLKVLSDRMAHAEPYFASPENLSRVFGQGQAEWDAIVSSTTAGGYAGKHEFDRKDTQRYIRVIRQMYELGMVDMKAMASSMDLSVHELTRLLVSTILVKGHEVTMRIGGHEITKVVDCSSVDLDDEVMALLEAAKILDSNAALVCTRVQVGNNLDQIVSDLDNFVDSICEVDRNAYIETVEALRKILIKIQSIDLNLNQSEEVPSAESYEAVLDAIGFHGWKNV